MSYRVKTQNLLRGDEKYVRLYILILVHMLNWASFIGGGENFISGGKRNLV